MALFENHAGFYLTTRKIQFVEVINKEKDFFLENVDELELEQSLSTNQSKNELVGILQNSLNELISRNNFQSKNVSFSLSHDFFKIVQIPFETTLLNKDLIDYFSFEFTTLFPGNDPEDFILRHYEISREGIVNNNTAIVIAVPKKIMSAIHEACISKKLILKNIDNAHVASNSFILVDNASYRKEIYCSIFIDDKFLSIILLDEKTPVYFKVSRIEEESELIDQIENEVSKFQKFGIGLENISKWYIGGDLADDDFMEILRHKFDASIIRYNPLDRTRVSSHMFENELFLEQYHCFTASAGMALRML